MASRLTTFMQQKTVLKNKRFSNEVLRYSGISAFVKRFPEDSYFQLIFFMFYRSTNCVKCSTRSAEGNVLHITRPDDWHLHLRDGKGLQDVVQHRHSTFFDFNLKEIHKLFCLTL